LTEEFTPITVLVVDDEKIIRELLGDTLEALGFKTITADCYKQAVEYLENKNIDIVVSDIVLPDKSGSELIKYIKNKYPRIPVLAISGKDVSVESIYKAGADGFIAKPFRISIVEDMIKKALIKYDINNVKPIAKGKNILVVDDEPSIVSTLIDSLDILGYQAEGAADGQDGLELLAAGKFDLVITDIKMPVKNGIDFMHEIKSKYPDLPVVIITGYPLAYPPKIASTEGADGYIAKPFRINQIEKILIKLLYN